MLKNKIIVKKIRNIVILFMALIIMFGAYKNIRDSRAEDVIEIEAIAIDNYGYLEDEKFILEAKEVRNDLYEIEIPENVNTKKINKIVKVTLEDLEENTETPADTTTENAVTPADTAMENEATSTNTTTGTATETKAEEQSTITENAVEVEIIDNKIELTKEEIENRKINIEVEYDIVIIESNPNTEESNQETASDPNAEIQKILLKEKSEEERTKIEITEETEMLYSKILKYEDEANNKLVEVRGYLPREAKLQIEDVSAEKVKEIFKERKIDVAYDIKIIIEQTKTVFVDENDQIISEEQINAENGTNAEKANSENQTGENASQKYKTKEITEIIEINPEDYAEKCEVTIKDVNIKENSQVYHVKEDNTYEPINVKDNTEENVSFEAQTFSIYAVGSEEGIMTTASMTNQEMVAAGYTYVNMDDYIALPYTVPITSTYLYIHWPIDGYVVRKYSWIDEQRTPYESTEYFSCGSETINGVTYTRIATPINQISKTKEMYLYLMMTKEGDYSDVKYVWTGPVYVALNGKIDAPIWKYTKSTDTSWYKASDYTKVGFYPLSDVTITEKQAYLEWNTSATNGTSNMTQGILNSSETQGVTGGGTYYQTLPNNVEGTYYLRGYGYAKDSNSKEISTGTYAGPFKIDTKAPTISLENQSSNSTWKKTHSVKVTISDGGSGLATGASIQYGWSTSSSTEPTSWSTASISSYSSGASSATFTATGSGISGKYYLWIKPTTLKDVVGNSATKKVSTGTFWFDNKVPTIEFSHESSNGKWAKTRSVSVTIQDEHSGLATGASIQYGWSTSNTTAPTSWSTASASSYSDGVNSATYTITQTGITGKFYLWIKSSTAKDVVGNTVTESKISTGTFWFDSTDPYYVISEQSDTTWKKDKTIYVTFYDDDSGISFGNQDYAGAENNYDCNVRYKWSTDPNVQATVNDTQVEYRDGTRMCLYSKNDMEGVYYLGLKLFARDLQDAADAGLSGPDYVNAFGGDADGEGGVYDRVGPFYIDNVAPRISLGSNGNSTWSKTHSVTVSLSDPGSGLAVGSSNKIKYGWSTSRTTAPTSYTYATLSNSSGAGSTTFTATGSGISGKYYLWIVPETYKDVAGNTNTTPVISTSTFWFDNTAPTGDPLIRKYGNSSGSDYSGSWSGNTFTGSWTNQSIYIAKNNSAVSDAHSGLASVTYTLQGSTMSASSTTLDPGSGSYGTYSATVTMTDNVGNSVTKSYTIRIDKKAPTVGTLTMKKINSSGATLSSGAYTNTNVYVSCTNGSDSESGHSSTTFSVTKNGSSYLSGQTSTTLTEEGTYSITLTTRDNAGNTSSTTKTVVIDKTRPYWTKTGQNIDKSTQTVTATVQANDSLSGVYSSSLTADNITIYVDGVVVTGLTKTVTSLGNNQYRITITGWEQQSRQEGKDYLEYSGTVQLQISAGTITDRASNTSNTQTISLGLVDVVKPEIQYKYQSTDIDHITEKYTMTFEITDKYYQTGPLTIDDLTIRIQAGQRDGSGKLITKNLLEEGSDVVVGLTTEEIRASSMPMTNTSGIIETVTNQLIGHRYTITIENFDEMMIKEGYKTADYSGVITVAVDAGAVADRSGNGNRAKTITTGMDIVSKTESGTMQVTDYVDPIWTQSGVSINPATQTATVVIKGTDTYFNQSTLTKNDIRIFVNGTETTSSGITINMTSAKSLTETRYVNNGVGTTSTTSVQYGVEYTLTLSGLPLNAYQVKLQIPSGKLQDQSGNVNKITDIIVFNTLKATNTETKAGSGFLSNNGIAREDIQRVIFKDNLTGINESTKWDVSAAGDGTIMAWYNESSAPYTVYIGSEGAIFANQNSSYLFAHIGYGTKCTATDTFQNIELLNTVTATNMRSMFWFAGYRSMTSLNLKTMDTRNVVKMREMFTGCGYNAMTSFSLGSNFYTTNVTDMSWMFADLGYKKLTSLGLGSNFHTNNVKDMSYMFLDCGYTAMRTLNLGANFNTENVTDMTYMFKCTGYTTMTELDLGSHFDTSKVTTMESMFTQCGNTAMTTLNLGNKFNTENVTNMESMFEGTGKTTMVALDLGDKFDTRNVTNMVNMFYETGTTSMISLDLGPAFVKIADKYTSICYSTGKSGSLKIYAPEAIYANKNAFKRYGTDQERQIEFTRGTIEVKYAPEWKIVGTTLDETNKSLRIQLKGKTNSNYTSNVTTNLRAEDISVYIGNVQLTNVTKRVEEANPSTGSEVTHIVTITNLEQAGRQIGKLYKEWSGNISIKIAGRGDNSSTYTEQTLVDKYGNQSMSKVYKESEGAWKDVIFGKDLASTQNKNESGKMFVDFIGPEITYKYLETDIDQELKVVKVVFSVTDKFYDNTQENINVNDLDVLIDGEEPVWKAEGDEGYGATKQITDVTEITENRVVDGVEQEVVIGREYTLIITDLEQDEIQEGDNYLNYSGAVTVGIPQGIAKDLSGNTSKATTITMGQDIPNTDIMFTLPVTEYTEPYLPDGYSYLEGNLETGLVIKDSQGNEYVWVEVPRSSEVYQTAGLDISQFTDTDYKRIEADLQTYTTTYREGTSYSDEWYSENETGLTKAEYNDQKKKMLKSIYKNGGFYVGRYETGIEKTNRANVGNTTETPVIKKNTYTYNYVTRKQAQELSESFATTGYSSSLMFGVQWDLILKYMETKGTTQEALNSNSTSWGNYNDSLWNITNSNAKYTTDRVTWINGAYGEKTESQSILLSTGADESFSKQNIYDLAGNQYEWTLETTLNSDRAGVARGGSFSNNSSTNTTMAKMRYGNIGYTYADAWIGFRTTLYKDEGTDALPESATTKPYLPDGYVQIEGDLSSGIVIQDKKGNEYVWVEVPRTAEVYQNSGLGITDFSEAEYISIETDLHTYTATYRNGTAYTDTWSSEDATGMTESEYNIQKKKMLKSIYKNGGFYVGRYEAGTETARTSSSDSLTTPVIKQNVYPYNYVTNAQAQTLSQTFATTGYTSSLMFGVQWDLVLKYMETKGVATQAELITDSTSWGNYNNNLYTITNTNAKYSTSGTSWTDGAYGEKTSSTTRAYLSTGASETFSKMGIYDLAGNVWEWTLEYSSYSSDPGAYRGGDCGGYGYSYPASFRGFNNVTISYPDFGFRTALYKDEGTTVDSEVSEPTYIPEGYAHVAGTTMETGYVIQDNLGNQYVWVEVPKTADVYQTAGVDITKFRNSEYKKIEADLHTYTSVYRNSNYSDTWSSEEATGLTKSEYTEQKKKMLKSIYLNEGFYVGRYETGTETIRSDYPLITPVIKQNVYPYYYVTNAQAQELSQTFATTGYTSSLLFGVQWDLMLKYLETKGVTQAELNEDSTSWGNCYDSLFTITNANAKYCVYDDANDEDIWIDGAYGEKTSSAEVYLSTGASEIFAKQNIYDLAGNMSEYTLESYNSSSYPCVLRAGNAYWSGWYASGHDYYSPEDAYINFGFRTALYKDEGTTGADVIADVVDPIWTASVIETDTIKQEVKIELKATDKYFEDAELDLDDIKIYGVAQDGTKTELTNIIKKLSNPEALTETRDGVEEQYGVKYTLTLSNFEEGTRKNGKLYKEWSGQTSLVIPANTIIDIYGNKSKERELSLGNIDLIKPNFTYIYSEEDINYEDKNVTVVFSVADKFYSSTNTNLTVNDLTILVDGELPGDTNGNGVIDGSETLGITREFTKIEDIKETRVVNGVSQDVVVGKTYTLLISNLQQNPNDGWDYSGIVSIAIPAGKVVDTTGNSSNARTITIGVDYPGTSPSTEYTTPYLPEGYSYVEGTTLTTGLVIKDSSGNEYVWVEVPKTTDVYQTAGLDVKSFTDEELTEIENDLHRYTREYREENYEDTWTSEDNVGMTETEYNNQKKKMLKSIYKNGGFYIGRYETGIENSYRSYEYESFIEYHETTETPVIKKNAYPYNWLRVSQAQELSETFATDGYTSSLMFGVQWDLVLKYLEEKGATTAELTDDSTNWGNYASSEYTITNSDAKYSQYNSGGFEAYKQITTYNKESGDSIILSTGALDTFAKQNIYDFAGNIVELTLESITNISGEYFLVRRGGNEHYGKLYGAVNYRIGLEAEWGDPMTGFRVSLYRDEDTVADIEEGEIVDVVDPVWIVQNKTTSTDPITGITTATMDLIATDKYFKESTLTKDQIEILVGGQDITSKAPELQVQLSAPQYVKQDASGNYVASSEQEAQGQKYSLKMSHLEETKKAFMEEIAKYRNNSSTGRLYREFSGEVIVNIPGGTIVDQSGNESQALPVELGVIDTLPPEIIYQYIESDIDYDAKTIKIVFSVTDKYYSTTNSDLTLNDLTILIDGENISTNSAVSKEITNITTLTATIDGVPNTVIGKQYTLLLSDLQQDPNNGWDYSGVVTVAIRDGAIADSSGNTNNGTTITMGMQLPEELPSNEYTAPYLPDGYSYVEGTLASGLVIKDSSGNEYVWVEVPRSKEVYPIAGTTIKNFTDEEYNMIETDLHTYTATYRNGTSFTDTWSSQEATGLTETQYNTQKKKMLKSIYKNGGFWIGRYEAGTETARTSSSNSLTTAVIKQNVYPYNYVTNAQAQTLSQTFATTGYTSSLMFGVQWDLVLKYMEIKGAATQAELITDSTSWGNYKNNLYTITNTSAKYSTSGTSWTDGPYGEKTSSTKVYLSTGASETFSKMGIYDLAGNVWEWTLEYTSDSSSPCASRGGGCINDGNGCTANCRYDFYVATNSYPGIGFRPALYRDEGTGADTGTSTNQPVIGDVVDPIWIVPEYSKSTITDPTTGITTATMDLIATDKYFKESTLTLDQIQVLVGGIDKSDELDITLSETAVLVKLDETTGRYVETTRVDEAVGQKYTFTLTNFEETDAEYFEAIAKYEAGQTGGRLYREFSGPVQIVVPAGTIVDQSGNTSEQLTVDLGVIDTLKPEIIYRYSEADIDKTLKKVKVVFAITDKYLEDVKLTAEDLTILVGGKLLGDLNENGVIDASEIFNEDTNGNGILDEGEDTNGNGILDISPKITLQETGTYKATVDGVANTIIGREFTLLLENLDQGDGEHWSGDVTIGIPAGQVTTDASGNKTLVVGAMDDIGNTNNAQTITIGIDLPEEEGSAETVDVVDPIWIIGTPVISTDIDGTTKATVTLTAYDKYLDRVTKTTAELKNLIKILVDGEDKTSQLNVTLTGPASDGVTYTYTFTGFEESDAEFFAQRDAYAVDPTTGRLYREFSGPVKIVVPANTIIDTSGNTNKQKVIDLGTIDTLKPEVIKVSSEVNHDNKTETVVFDIVDKYFATSAITTTNTSKIHTLVDGTEVTNITKQITNIETLTTTIGEDTNHLVGYRYTLKLSNFGENSGNISIKIDDSTATDLNNTSNVETTLSSDFVDFIKPVIEKVAVSNPIDETNKTYTISFKATDKYFDTTHALDVSKITVKVDGETAESIAKPASVTDSNKNKIFKEITSTAITGGCQYTLVLSNFEQYEKQTGKDFMEWSGTISIEISANAVKDEIPDTVNAKTKYIKDGATLYITEPNGTNENKLENYNIVTTINGEFVDFVKPVIEKVSSTKGTNTETIVFKVTDKYIDTGDSIIDSDINVYIDGENASGLIQSITSTPITNTFNKTQSNGTIANGTYVIGHTYTVVLGGFEQSTRNAKNYKDWSGTVSIEIAQNAIYDKNPVTGVIGNSFDSDVAERTIMADFVDFIKPDLKYVHDSADIDKSASGKSYKMTFDITDKYYTSGQLTLDDLIIKMQNGQLDSEGNPIIYDLKQEEGITITWGTPEEIRVPSISMTKTDGTVGTVSNQLIGYRYTITVTNLERLEIAEGRTTADYSGVVTVAVASNKIVDRTGNKNNANTITSGVSIPGGRVPDNIEVVDVVDPLITMTSSLANAINHTATVEFKVTDTYFNTSAWIRADGSINTTAINTFISSMQVLVNGTVTTSGITVSLEEVTALTETRYTNNGINSTTQETVTYGLKFKVTLTGFANDVNQVKLRVPASKFVDKSGNTNKQTDIIAYNVLKSTSTERSEDSAFLGGTIQRQNIEKITFLSSTATAPTTGWWDVSAQGDESIIAWTTQTSAPYTVYIASDWKIFANRNSDNLFRYIGYASTCTATQTIVNINLLNTNNVTSMNNMFDRCGYTAMTTLDLKDNFDTSNVIYMLNMFNNCGLKSMTTLNLGNNFDTSEVINMSGMFNSCGMNKMTSLDLGGKFDTSNVTNMTSMFSYCSNLTTLNLGDKFDTSNVTNMTSMFKVCTNLTVLDLGNKFDTSKVTSMNSMFYNFGRTNLTELDLGDLFDTTNVTNMNSMFYHCGTTAMTRLDLGNKFNTAKVTDMYRMFYNCGTMALTSLDLGDQFYTTVSTTMEEMFYGCGTNAMTVLDLGPAFTRLAPSNSNMFKNCGKSSLVIYAPEVIYGDKTSFK